MSASVSTETKESWEATRISFVVNPLIASLPEFAAGKNSKQRAGSSNFRDVGLTQQDAQLFAPGRILVSALTRLEERSLVQNNVVVRNVCYAVPLSMVPQR
jgi:hypothetical protein